MFFTIKNLVMIYKVFIRDNRYHRHLRIISAALFLSFKEREKGINCIVVRRVRVVDFLFLLSLFNNKKGDEKGEKKNGK